MSNPIATSPARFTLADLESVLAVLRDARDQSYDAYSRQFKLWENCTPEDSQHERDSIRESMLAAYHVYRAKCDAFYGGMLVVNQARSIQAKGEQ